MGQHSTRGSARLRTILFSSAAFASMAIANTAHAQATVTDPGAPTNAYREAQDGGATISGPSNTVTTGGAYITPVAPDPQIVIANPNTPTTARDPVNITGVGQMVVDQGNGFIGLCTATLINPRTVVFAAHCVNEQAANTYGNGGTAIGFGFSNANLAGIQHWLPAIGGTGRTNTNDAFYNSNYVAYNPASLEPNANGFLYSDVAVASLDTPAGSIPTWALLFSPLPDPGTIGANGTGYHVAIEGYGNNGTASSGSTGGIDFRRRLAENMLGGLASIDEFENFLFGGNSTTNPQNLYWIDFDDPRRGTANPPSPYDFNAWRDNAVPPNASGNSQEGITASGDSGGPLILDKTYAKKLVIGVLSGGYTRFFNGQPANGYGTASFYQPLYLYWDWIAANNPYHYVGSVAGNGNWTDPNHWVTNLDPNYYILGSNGQPINGIPTAPGAGNTDQPGFGQACFQSGGVSDCYDVASDTETVTATPIGQGGDANAANDKGSANVADLNPELAAQGTGSGGASGSQSPQLVAVLPAPTLANGLPGATGFVPNNDNGNAANSVAPKYFDVTLGAAGTTTLGGAVTIDRFTISNAGAMLDIQAGGSLTSLINVSQITGTMQVNGLLATPGDYMILTGGLNGSGIIRSPFTTNVAGVIAPGTPTTIGTLTFQGNLILSSGSVLMMNLGPNGTSDKIVVSTTKFSSPGVAVDGQASIGGSVVFSPVAGYTIRSGDTFTILTNQSTRTGTFSTGAISAILTPTFIYNPNDVQVRIQAGTYAGVVDPNSPVQAAYAKILDGDRAGSYSALADLYGPLDLQNQATIRATLDSWAPRGETLKTALGEVATDNMARFWRDRLGELGSAQTGGTIAIIGQPLGVLANVNNVGPSATMEAGANAGADATSVTTGRVPDDLAVFFAGGYLNGSAKPMPTAIPLGGRSTFDGWYAAAGVEKSINNRVSIGFGLSYTRVDGDTTAGDNGKGELFQGTLYAKAELASGVTFDGVASAGLFDIHTRRGATLVGNNYVLRGSDQSLALSGELGLSKMWDVGAVKIGPRGAIRYGEIGFSRSVETGGPMALTVNRTTFDSLQTRIGLVLDGAKGNVRPYLNGYYVHDFAETPASFGANFVGGVGPAGTFALAGVDKDWWEVSGGLAIDLKNVTLTLGADTTIDRTDVKNQSYRAGLKIRF